MLEYKFEGKHLIAEYYNIDFEKQASFKQVEKYLQEAIKIADVTCVDVIGQEFEPMGYTIVVALLESHISVHAYPEHAAMFIDVFTCGEKNPKLIHDHLIHVMGVIDYRVEVINRGD